MDVARQWGVVVIMNSTRRCTRLMLLALALAGLTAPSAQPASGPVAEESIAGVPESAQAGIRPEGRLRKLHLVRPDLIPYPIAYEVYC